MLADVNTFLYIMSITIGMFMIVRYVLLEPAMEMKKQWIFYAVSFCLVIGAVKTVGEHADVLSVILVGLGIVLGRKKNRLRGILLVIPVMGLMNGIASPVHIVRILLGGYTGDTLTQFGVLCVYILILAALVLFFIKGRNWRGWFHRNMKNRRPHTAEYVLVCVSGVLNLMFSNLCTLLSRKISEIAPAAEHIAGWIVVFYMTLAFVLTLTLIVMIMQGNKRKFYHDKVSGMQFSIIATMADIVENRDENTGGHIKRTAKYVEIIGQKLRADGKFSETLTEQYLSDMIVAAPLHDIGKIHIPDSILNKPARLTEEEFEIMKTHTIAGRDVLLKAKDQLGAFEYLETAVEMAESHHEWWNGNGYPRAISGEAIPLSARIMAVADVFDALTAKRCYKEAMPVEQAYRIIEEETGTHFDPVVAAAFQASKDKVAEALAGGQATKNAS